MKGAFELLDRKWSLLCYGRPT